MEKQKIVIIIISIVIIGLIGFSQNKLIAMDDIHDIAVISLVASNIIERGDDLPFETVVKNMGTYNETNFQVTGIIKDDGGDTIWAYQNSIHLKKGYCILHGKTPHIVIILSR